MFHVFLMLVCVIMPPDRMNSYVGKVVRTVSFAIRYPYAELIRCSLTAPYSSHCLYLVEHSYCIRVTLLTSVSHSSQFLPCSQLIRLRLMQDSSHVCVEFAAGSCHYFFWDKIAFLQECDANVYFPLFLAQYFLHPC